ncbi:hypothetical protein GGE56_007686 [Rhizobium leguminosarum]|nr:hypothetical protein [Rhizobium leguminosarum]MBB6299327.1 hypothetical protein [Rhizobium leguminosarum]
MTSPGGELSSTRPTAGEDHEALQFAEFGVKRFDVNGLVCRFRLGFITENARSPIKELVFPLLDLVGVHVERLAIPPASARL